MPAPLLLLSTNSARLRRPDRRDAIRQLAVEAIRRRSGTAPEVVEASDAGQAEQALAAARSGGTALVVVAGGDGSVRTAAGALAGSEATLGIVPTGTGNLFAASLGIARDPRMAARQLATVRLRQVDLGEVETGAGRGAFVVACGAGFDARVMAMTSAQAKARFGIAAYFAAAFRAARTVRGASTRITADGTTLQVRSLATLVANAGEIIPGVLGPRTPIRPDDGLLDLIVVTGRTALQGAVPAIAALMEASVLEPGAVRKSWGALRLRASRIRVETDPPEPIEVDGDLIGEAGGWLEAAIRPGVLRVIAGERLDR